MSAPPNTATQIDPVTDTLPTLQTIDAVVEYCRQLGISVSDRLVRQDRSAGKLPYYRMGHQASYSCADVRTWIEGRRRDRSA